MRARPRALQDSYGAEVGPEEMHRLVGSADEREEQETWEVPEWSGVPVIVGHLMVVPFHCGDMRNMSIAEGWTSLGFYITKGGDVEYHIYRR